MSGRTQAQPKVTAKSSEREADWHPAQMRSFAAPTTGVPPQEAERPDLVGAYLQRRRVASASEELTSRGEEAVAGPAVQRAPAEDSAPSAEARSQPAENRTGMPDRLKTGLEQLSGHGLSAVNVHYNSAKPAQLNALAYTQGTDIHVGPGQEKHLPHEGWHAVQQLQGRVKPTMEAHGVSINDDAGLEREANVMGAKALQMRRADQVTNPVQPKLTGRAGGNYEQEAERVPGQVAERSHEPQLTVQRNTKDVVQKRGTYLPIPTLEHTGPLGIRELEWGSGPAISLSKITSCLGIFGLNGANVVGVHLPAVDESGDAVTDTNFVTLMGLVNAQLAGCAPIYIVGEKMVWQALDPDHYALVLASTNGVLIQAGTGNYSAQPDATGTDIEITYEGNVVWPF